MYYYLFTFFYLIVHTCVYSWYSTVRMAIQCISIEFRLESLIYFSGRFIRFGDRFNRLFKLFNIFKIEERQLAFILFLKHFSTFHHS